MLQLAEKLGNIGQQLIQPQRKQQITLHLRSWSAATSPEPATTRVSTQAQSTLWGRRSWVKTQNRGRYTTNQLSLVYYFAIHHKYPKVVLQDPILGGHTWNIMEWELAKRLFWCFDSRLSTFLKAHWGLPNCTAMTVMTPEDAPICGCGPADPTCP